MTQSNPNDQDNAYSLSRNVGSNPGLRSTYERLYGNSGPLKLPEIRPAAPPQVRAEPTMPDIPPEMMRQIMASLAQRGFSTAKGKPKLASKMAKSQWNSRVDDAAQSAYGSRLDTLLKYRTQPGPASWYAQYMDKEGSGSMLDPEYVRRLYEV
jgi:hypothetical protein